MSSRPSEPKVHETFDLTLHTYCAIGDLLVDAFCKPEVDRAIEDGSLRFFPQYRELGIGNGAMSCIMRWIQ